MTKIGTYVALVTRDSDTTFKVRAKGQGHLWLSCQYLPSDWPERLVCGAS